ncbi:MAG: 16S rRNA (adenine(1518)-N(6)/adenine(1519)-N(6))-dimethyltransferase RsmA [Alphaproteobacteria bacterium]|nr:16S rRNA (adenine(1518)-N(6)/adenine(1519)-N(6))-dimethyltransferase RsmA [Alphaproteobacteria bacterium]MDP6517452.1 16S rRNA (adenine(1518)-N(6)/adenine(1519)-N(6))-dimethyltransferase RsmA [Alphaproteobacteria bacterium]
MSPADGRDREFDPGLLPPLRDIIAAAGLDARKGLGQNFLLDLNLCGRIARAAGDLRGITVIEVGPGPGGLTRALLATEARAIIAIERDRRCRVALDSLIRAAAGRLRVIEGDASAIDPAALAEPPIQIVANLPYNVATPLLINWLRRIGAYRRLTLMFQKEVAQRLAAAPGGRTYGRLSVITQWLCAVTLLFDVPARAFTPAPKVTSTVVDLAPRPVPLAPARFQNLEKVTAVAFGQRRKMLRSSLRQLGPDPRPLLAAAGVRETARAEELSIEQFCALARAVDDRG